MMALVACAGPKDAQPTAPSEVAVGEKQPERAQPTISAKLRAHDGTALRAGFYSVRRPGFAKPVAEGELDGNGAFRVEVEPGLYAVSVSGVDHAQLTRNVVVDDTLELSGTLGTYDREQPGATLPVLFQFLDAAGKVLGKSSVEAARIDDTHYRALLGTVPAGATQLRHQVRIAGGRTINGPGGQSFTYDGGGDYWAVVPVPSDGALVLDPTQLPPSGKASAVELQGDDPVAAVLRSHSAAWERERTRIFSSAPRRDGKIFIDTGASAEAMTALRTRAWAEVEGETRPREQMLLHAMYATTFVATLPPQQIHEQLRWFVANVPVDDRLLGIGPGLGQLFFVGLRDADAELVASGEAWLERFAREQPEPGVAIEALEALLYRADERGEQARTDELYAIGVSPRFAGTYSQDRLARAFDPKRIMRRGNALPDFEFAAIGDASKRVTKRDRAGKLYLVEFWATWCGPCVAAMPELHASYMAVNGARKGKGKAKTDQGLRKLRTVAHPELEFVFVSLDQNEQEVVDFRRKHWSMPWTHGFAGIAEMAELERRFGMIGVPSSMLIDEQGTIIEYGASLRGEKLTPTLQRVLAARKNRASD